MAHASTIRKTKPSAQPKAEKVNSTVAKKIKSVEKHPKKAVSAPQNKQVKTKSVEVKVKTKSRKSEKAISVKRSDKIAVGKKSAALMPSAKTKSKTLGTKTSAVKKISAKPQLKELVKKSKSIKSEKIKAQKKNAPVKSSVSVARKTSAKILPAVSTDKTNPKIKKNAPKTERSIPAKSIKTQIVSAAKKTKAVKTPTIIKAKKSAQPQLVKVSRKAKPAKVQIEAPHKKIKLETVKSKEMIAAKTLKGKLSVVVKNKKPRLKFAEEIGINNRKYSLLRKQKPYLPAESSNIASKEIKQSLKNSSATSKTLAGKNLHNFKAVNGEKNELKNVHFEPESVAPKLKKKKAKAIGPAVFRGKKTRYDFEVFPIDAEFEDVPAIYVISKRKIDKRKKAHHALVCIGQTQSLVADLKKHRKGKCFKKFAANSISLLREENEKQRLKIETDLKAAHAIPCVHT